MSSTPATDKATKAAQAASKQALRRDLLTIAARAKSGARLSQSERARLEAAASEADDTADGADLPDRVASLSELGRVLGKLLGRPVSRQLISAHSQKPEAPKPGLDGSINVAEWIHYLKGASRLFDDVDGNGDVSISQARTRLLNLQAERAQFRLNVDRGAYIPKDGMKRVLAQLLTAAKSRSLAGVGRLVTLIRMAPDTAEANEIARAEMIAIWQELSRGSWYDRHSRQVEISPAQSTTTTTTEEKP